MRPPHCAGEIGTGCRGWTAAASGFNEAPALRGGNPRRRATCAQPHRRFNEAPALRGGNLAARRRGQGRRVLCFNEAPALRGGNPRKADAEFSLKTLASMRPPHCAGEIRVGFRRAPQSVPRALQRGPRIARGKSGFQPVRVEQVELASMRPPHCAGEIEAARRLAERGDLCFNEAPALRGGNRLGIRRRRRARQPASMRPPHCAGEISTWKRTALSPATLQ